MSCFFVFKQKTAYEMRISDWSSDVCSSDLIFADEIIDAGDGHVPAMGVYAGGFAAAEAEVLLCFGEVAEQDYDIDSVRTCITEIRTGIEIASSPFAGITAHGPAEIGRAHV